MLECFTTGTKHRSLARWGIFLLKVVSIAWQLNVEYFTTGILLADQRTCHSPKPSSTRPLAELESVIQLATNFHPADCVPNRNFCVTKLRVTTSNSLSETNYPSRQFHPNKSIYKTFNCITNSQRSVKCWFQVVWIDYVSLKLIENYWLPPYGNSLQRESYYLLLNMKIEPSQVKTFGQLLGHKNVLNWT